MSNTEPNKLKPEDTTTSVQMEKQQLFELKNGKVILRQKALSMEKMSETMQEIVLLRGFIESRMKENLPPLQSIPEEHLPLIAKLAHESDRTLGSLARHIQSALQPEDLEIEEDKITPSQGQSQLRPDIIENAILIIADRNNYGVDWLGKQSASLSVWRWELKEERMDWLPKSIRDKLENRMSERRQAKKDLRSLYDSLSQAERDSLQKGTRKGKADCPNVVVVGFQTSDNNENKVAVDRESEKAGNGEDYADTKNGFVRPKHEKAMDSERAAKDKEKAEKKAAKAEKEHREKEAQNKSRTIMSAFFNKPKASIPKAKIVEPSRLASPNKTVPSSSKTDFEKTFKPFVVKKDASVAPINYFEWRNRSKEVIVIDQEITDPNVSELTETTEVNGSLKPKELLSLHLEVIPSALRLPARTARKNEPRLKISSKYCVRSIMSQLSGAEVLGDAFAVRRLQSLLLDRTKIPAKVLIFHEDTRPGYFGTFTKSSSVVGPRCPFAKDAVVFDYSYDSGEEWEEEEEGGEDVISQEGSEDEAGEADSDLDNWLVEDDEDIDPGTPISERDGSPTFPPLQNADNLKKRKSTVLEKKEPKKRKVVPLVPFIKGPCYEDEIGHCDYEPFKRLRIQLFNDTPFSIDPFTFVSKPLVPESTAYNKGTFAVPAPPTYVGQSALSTSSAEDASALASAPTASSSSTYPVTILLSKRKATMTVKTPFPDALMPFLADKVATLATGNLTWLIESLYQDLKVHKVKKVSIEAKVREVVEKCPAKKVWIVKNDVLSSIGMPTVSNTTIS